MSTFIPTKFFLTKGVGVHKDKLSSFELALRDAGIQHCNLVSVSSIIPPKAKQIPKKEGLNYIKPGQIIYVVISRNETNEPNRLISASIGLAIPQDKNMYGYLSEFHSYGMTGEKSGDYAEDLAAYMLASTLGLEIDPDKGYDEQKELWRISGKIVKTSNITQSMEGDKNGKWTTVVAAAVLLP
ncbi:MAG: arginine decarboxylase, pyruvoyl-dependent [Nitrososphaeria archaeon]